LKPKNKTRLIFFLFCLFLFSCKKQSCIEKNEINEVIRLSFINKEDTIYHINSFQNFQNFTKNNPLISSQFFESDNSQIKEQKLYSLINNIYFDSLYFQVKNTFGSFEEQKKEIEQSFSRLKTLLPSIKNPIITTVISGFYNDIVVIDNKIIVGLDYFLDPDSKYKPQDIPKYILRRYKPNNIVPMIMSVYCTQFNQINPLDQTMISEMLNFGKLYYLLSSILPCVPLHAIIGYTQEEWDLVEENENKIYSVFVERKLFFETNHLIKNKYLSERPKVFEISASCPGRIGLWLGWKIINSYMNNNKEIKIEELLQNTNNQEIFFQSSYKPS